MKNRRSAACRAVAVLVTAFILSATSGFGQALPAQASTNAPAGGIDQPAYAPGEVLVKFRNDVTDEQIATAFRGARLQFVKQLQTEVMQQRGDIGITRALTAMPVEQAVTILSQVRGVAYAEPNWVYTHQSTSNDPYYTGGSLWGMYGDSSSPMNAFGSQAAEAWAAGYVGSAGVVVGIIDEGVQITHPDLKANIWNNPGETADGIDNDGNGLVDDVNGWDFFNDDKSVYDGTSDDHGTHVAGTIGAAGGNGLGVAGVNWSVSMIPAKFLGPNGGYTSDAVNAVDYFTALKLRGVNVVAINNSWGGGGYSQSLHDAIIRAAKAGILFVAAAGNGNRVGKAIDNDVTPYYPACYNTSIRTTTEEAASYDSVIAVTAIDSSGKKASFGNYGAKTVDLGAPGVAVNSTVPTDSYGAFNGTSMATPHVTGAIALYASTHATTLALERKQAILGSAAATASLNGITVTGGRLDLSTVINPPLQNETVPTAPSDLTAAALSHSEIQLEWADNSNNESRFEITRGSSSGTTILTVGANTTTYKDTGLTPGTTYTYSIKACNSAGCTDGINPVQASATTRTVTAATATFVGSDDATKGNWINKYGKTAYDIISYTKTSTAGTIGFAGTEKGIHTWSSRTGDSRGLQTPNGKSRFAQCWFTGQPAGNGLYLDVNLTDGLQHQVAIYLVDWDNGARVESIEIVDRNYGTSLHSLSDVSGFYGGRYLSWDITGPVFIKIKYVGGSNAVVSGIFID